MTIQEARLKVSFEIFSETFNLIRMGIKGISPSHKEEFQLCIHLSLVWHGTISNRSRPGILTVPNRMHVVRSTLRIGHLSVAWLLVSL